MSKAYKIIPSLFTSIALLAGCISIVYASRGQLVIAGYLIIAAAVLDFIDGFLARVFNAITNFGKQLDSLSDLICFGVAPAFIMLQLVKMSLVDFNPQFNIDAPTFGERLILGAPFILTLFAALRLARFNISDNVSEAFKGLPTPVAALFIIALGYELSENFSYDIIEGEKVFILHKFIFELWFLLAVIIVLSGLMISNIKMITLKFRDFSLKTNTFKYSVILISVVLIVLFRIPGIAFAILVYLLFSLIKNIVCRV